MKLQQVHLRINDASTGQPTPVRLRITDAEGNYYVPHGRLTEFASRRNQDVGGNVYVGMKPWAYIDGTCEILLPPGILHVQIAKGPEYQPIDAQIQLTAGKMSLRISIERWSDVRKQGWYSGDTRIHFLPPHAALLEGQAEDIAVVNLLAQETLDIDVGGKRFVANPNLLAFSGQTFALQSPDCGVAVNTYNFHHDLGSLGLLHCHRPVYPLTFSLTNNCDWTMADWCDQCHRKKGLVVWTDPLHESPDFRYGEPLADLILGKVDAFEITFWEDSPFDALVDYYHLLDAGLVVPLVGASAKESNGLPLGGMRTYALLQTGESFTYKNWIEAVRAGRTFASNGPLLHFTINGVVPGTTWDVSSGNPLHVRVDAKSGVSFDQLELLWQGQVIAAAAPTASAPQQATLEWELPAKRSGWLAARCRGQSLLPSRPAPQRVFAHSSAVAVRRAEAPGWAKPESVVRLLKELDNMLHWTREAAGSATPEHRERLAGIFEEARTELAKKQSL